MYRRGIFLSILLLTCSALGRDNGEGWIEVRSPDFVVISNSSEKQARHIAGQFERLRSVFRGAFPRAKADPISPIVILSVKDKKDFQALEPAADLAGVFLPAAEKNYVLLRLDAQGEHPYATVYHAYIHLLLKDVASWLPLWLNEGLAEFFQNTEIHEKDAQLGGVSAEDVLYLKQNRLLPLETLLAVDAKSPYYHGEEKGSIFYAESWALTHFLEMADNVDHTHRVADYVDLVNQHVDPVTAGERVFSDLGQLLKGLEAYLALPNFRFFHVDVPAGTDESSYSLKTLPLPDAEAVQADFLAYSDRGKDARALLETVLRDDPKNAQAHETMGFLEYQAGNLDTARKSYEQAIERDPHSYLAQYYFAAISLQSGAATPPEKIEASLRAAIKLNPKFAPSYDALAMFYRGRHERLAEAHMLELHAVSLDPSNLSYRLDTAAVLQDAQRYHDAINVLHSSSGLAKTTEETATLANRIKTLEQYQAQQQPAADADKQGSSRAEGQSGAQAATASENKSIAATPVHPTEEPHGPKLLAKGFIKGVKCTDPSTIELKVEGGSRNFSLYSNNYFQITYSAANFTPDGEIHPCTDLEGMSASVQYSATSDKTVDGQILSVQLSK